MRPLVQDHLNQLIPYIPGKPIEETEREYGVSDLAKLASNENGLGPSPKAVEAARAAVTQAHLYPDAGCYYLKEKLKERHGDHGVGSENLVIGNGTNEIITLLVRAFVGPGEALLNAWPSFVCYKLAARSCGRTEHIVPLPAELDYDLDAMLEASQKAAADPDADRVKMVFIGNPNNPTGKYIPKAKLDAFIEGLDPEVIVIIDEAYAEYVEKADYPDAMEWVKKRPRTCVTRTFSKIYGLAAMRIGYAVCDPDIADILNRMRDPFNVNAVAQAAALAALDDHGHIEKSRAHNNSELPRIAAGLEKLGIEVTPSVANFVLARFPEGAPDVPALFESLIKERVIVRPVTNYGLERAVRISAGTREENDRLLGAVARVLGA
jgi:histidinol-phosphate aminotransferase